MELFFFFFFLEKNEKNNKFTLMSANLRLSVTCAVSNVGDVPTQPPMHFNWIEVTEEIKCGRLEHIGQQDDVGCMLVLHQVLVLANINTESLHAVTFL